MNGEAAVGAALHAQLLPEVGRVQPAARDHGRALPFMAEVAQARALADVVHLRRDAEPLARRQGLAAPGVPLWRGGGQGLKEGAQLRPEGGHVGFVQRHVGDHAVAVDEAAAHVLKYGTGLRFSRFALADAFAQEEEVADAAHLLTDPAGLGEVGAEARVDDRVSAGDEAAFGAGLLLQRQLQEAAGIVEVDVQQHIAQDVEHVLRLGEGALGAQHQPGAAFLAATHGGEQRAGADAASLAANALRQADVILVARAHLQQRGAEERQPGQHFTRQRTQVQPQVEVDDAVGEEVVRQQFDTLQLFLRQRDDAALTFEVLKPQQRDAGLGLRRVGRFLGQAQSLRFRFQFLQLSFAHGIAGGIQACTLGGAADFVGSGVGLQQHRGAVLVLEQPVADERFKPGLALREARLDGRQRRLEG